MTGWRTRDGDNVGEAAGAFVSSLFDGRIGRQAVDIIPEGAWK
jgi:hypothetical protein